MNDMSHVIEPKSDQINADDLISGPMTITIESVQIKGGQEQPVSIFFNGSDKAFRPCKSMSRVLVAAWGPEANKYVGRSLTLYRDPTVKWAGMEVGGIRISHMSDIPREMMMALTATKGSRKPFVVKQLEGLPATHDKAAAKPKADKALEGTRALMRRIQAATTDPEIDEIVQSDEVVGQRKWLAENRPELSEQLDKAISVAKAQAEKPAAASDPFGESDEVDYYGLADKAVDQINAASDPQTVSDVMDATESWPEEVRRLVSMAADHRMATLKV